MTEKKLLITLPDKVIKYFNLKAGNKATLNINKDNMKVDFLANNSVNSWNVPLWWGVLPALLEGFIFFLYFWVRGKKNLFLTGTASIASGVIILGVISGIILFSIFLIKDTSSQRSMYARLISWRTLPTIVTSFFIILLVGILSAFWVLGIAFKGASFDLLTSAGMSILFLALINYFMIEAAVSLTPTILTNLFTLLIIGGVLVSMSTNSNIYWWRHNLSFLGTKGAIDSWQFNLTIIFSAVLMLALIDYLFVSLSYIYKITRKTLILRISLCLIAISLGSIGIFPNNANSHILHKVMATMLILIIIFLILGIRWLWPGISKEFLHISDIIGIIMLVTFWLFKFEHYLSLTAFELINFLLAFIWLLILFQIIQATINKLISTFTVSLTD